MDPKFEIKPQTKCSKVEDKKETQSLWWIRISEAYLISLTPAYFVIYHEFCIYETILGEVPLGIKANFWKYCLCMCV